MSLIAFAREEAQRHGLDPDLVERVVMAESGGRAGAVSRAGARGPMQLMPATARDLGVNIDDPLDNIRGGVRYLKQQMDAFGAPELALAAYNAGPGRVRRAGGVPNIPETQAYVQRIIGGSGQTTMQGGQAQDELFDGSAIFGAQPPAPAGGAPADGFDGSAIFGPAAPKAGPAPPPPPDPPPPARPAAKPNFAVGFAKGVNTPFDNAALAVETGVNSLGGLFGAPTLGVDISHALGQPSAAETADAHKAFLARSEAAGHAPGHGGQFVGNVVGTLPSMLATKNPVVGGAIAGGLLTESRDPLGVLKDTAIGGVTGGVVGSVFGAASRLFRGGDPAVRTLRAAGMDQMTPGQVLGGVVRRIEDKLISVPGVGDVIAARQAATIPALNRAAADDVLSSIGMKTPADLTPGHEMVGQIGKVVSNGYNRLLAPLTVRLDAKFATDLKALAPDIASLAPADQAQVQAILQHQVSRRLGAGPIKGEALKEVESYLTGQIGKFRKTADKGEIADVLWDVQQAFRDMLARQNPAAAQTLKAYNLAYAKLMRLESAAANAVDGVASPAQLKQAVVRGAGRRTAARGEGLLQDLANAGAKVIPQKVPDSGTAGRLLNATIPGMISAVATSPVLPLYTGAGQKLVGTLFGGARPVAAQAAAELLARLKTPALVGSTAIVAGAGKKPVAPADKRK